MEDALHEAYDIKGKEENAPSVDDILKEEDKEKALTKKSVEKSPKEDKANVEVNVDEMTLAE